MMVAGRRPTGQIEKKKPPRLLVGISCSLSKVIKRNHCYCHTYTKSEKSTKLSPASQMKQLI